MKPVTNQSLPHIDASQEPLPSMGVHDLEKALTSLDTAWINWIYDRQANGYSFYKFDVTFNSSGLASPFKWISYFIDNGLYLNKNLST